MIYGDKLDLADELEEEFRAKAKGAMGEAGTLLLGDVQQRLRRRQGTRLTVAPPGEPPEMDTGVLVASFKRIPPSVKGRIASSGIQSDHPGANRLEFGMTDRFGRRTLPHHYVAPALAAMEAPITALLQERLT